MDRKALEQFARVAAQSIKTEADLEDFRKILTKVTVETALNAELDTHLGSAKHQKKPTPNSRNGYTPKRLKTDDGTLDINVPRDRDASFEPQLVRKHQTRFQSMDNKILSLYAKGMTTREIVETFKEMYDADVSPTVISNVTDAVHEQIIEWQSRPLDPLYPIVYLDCLVVKIRKDRQVLNQSVYLALGVNTEGRKELLGLWIQETEGAKFWLSVLTELQNRGIADILIACVDGLKGFPDAIRSVFPQTQVQLCIVHMIRNSMKYVVWKDYKAVTTDLKAIYQAATEEEAVHALDAFGQKWDSKYPQISRSWQAHWSDLNTFFGYAKDIRKAIYTTNAIESLNSVIRKAIKKRKLFPTEGSAKKVIFLAIQDASKKWTMPIQNWKLALNRFIIEFEERITRYL